jgi:hypothetical protein
MKKNSLTLFILTLALFFGASSASIARAQSAQPSTPATAPAQQQAAPEKVLPAQNLAAQQAALVTEFEVGGLKVLVKRRAGSQTVVAGLFLRGGARNITAENAGIEALMLDSASEASLNYPRERLRRELSRMGTSISYGVNYDYSAFTLASTMSSACAIASSSP